MINLSLCDAVLDACCPAWRRDGAVTFNGQLKKNIYNNTYEPVVPRPLSTTGLRMGRDRGLVREIVISTGPWWPYLSPQLRFNDGIYITVTLDEAHIAAPGRKPGSTIYALTKEVSDAVSAANVGWELKGIMVGTDKEIKAAIVALNRI